MPSSPYSSFADCSLLQQLRICSCSVVGGFPPHGHGPLAARKTFLCGHRWTFSLWLPSADPADHQGYGGGLLCQQGKFLGTQRITKRFVKVNLFNASESAPPGYTLQIRMPCLSSLLHGCRSHCRSAQTNIDRMGLTKYCMFSGTFWGQTLVLGRLKQIQLRFIQLYLWSQRNLPRREMRLQPNQIRGRLEMCGVFYLWDPDNSPHVSTMGSFTMAMTASQPELFGSSEMGTRAFNRVQWRSVTELCPPSHQRQQEHCSTKGSGSWELAGKAPLLFLEEKNQLHEYCQLGKRTRKCTSVGWALMKVSPRTLLPFLGSHHKGLPGSSRVLQMVKKVNPAGLQVWGTYLWRNRSFCFPFSFQICIFKIYGYAAFPADFTKIEQNSQELQFAGHTSPPLPTFLPYIRIFV